MMPRYAVTYSMNVLYSTEVEAENEAAALSMVNDGNIGESSETVESEFLCANDAELIA